MDFTEAESKYFELRGRLESGALTPEQFQAQVGQLRVQDEQGRYWAIDARSGAWLLYDGANWVPSQPPAGVSPAASPAPPPVPRRGGPPVLLIGAVAVVILLCVIALGGAGLILSRPGGGPEGGEEAAVITQEEAETIADDFIAGQFPDLEDAEKTITSYQNLTGTEFWTITYRREVQKESGGQTYTIPRIVIVSVDKETGETTAAVSS
jgi:hypothetical protein